MGTNAPVSSPVQLREQGLTLLQQVRGRYLSINYDVPALLMTYVRLLDQLGVMSKEMKTCKLQCRMLYEGHSVLYTSLKKLRQTSSADAEMRFAGGLELAWHALKPLHSAMQEWIGLDEMESWFRHGAIVNQISEMWKTLDVAIVELRSELGGELNSFVALKETPARVLVVPGSADIARRQLQRADQLELSNLFKNLVSELDSSSPLIFMKAIYIEEFMAAIQRDMNSYPAKSQTYKLYDERLQQLYQRSKVLPPVNEFDVNDIRRVGNISTTDTRFGPVWKGKTSAGDIVSVKLCSAFNATDKSRQTLYSAVQRWNRLRHPNLQRILGLWYPPNVRDGVFSIVSKGIKNGDAIQCINSNPSIDRIHLLLGVALGLKYLHAQGIPHGDLRGNSVLIKDNGDACLTNFGLVGALEEACDAFVAIALVNLGSVRWMAPEIYEPELIGKERGTVSKEADCHSFGMLILELITGQKPFMYISQDPVVVVELVRGGRPTRPAVSTHARQTSPQPLDDSLWSLCESCWAFPPAKRLAVGDIVDSIRTYQHTSRAEEARAKSPLLYVTALQNDFSVPPPALGHVPKHQLSAVDTEYLERVLDLPPEPPGVPRDQDSDKSSATENWTKEQEHHDVPVTEEFEVEPDPPTQDAPPPTRSPPSFQHEAPIIDPLGGIVLSPPRSVTSPASDKTVRPARSPGYQHPRIEEIYSTSTSSNPSLERVVVHSPPRDQRIQSTSEHSLAHSQSSKPSRSSVLTARSPKHPDLANQVLRVSSPNAASHPAQPSIVPPSITVMEQLNNSGTFGNRLSTIPDVDDGEEAQDEYEGGDEEEHRAVQQWARSRPDTGDWDFLRLVQEYRRQRNGPDKNVDGTYIPPPHSPRHSQYDEDEDSSTHTLHRPHDFPPAPDIFPTPIHHGKPLPELPPSTPGGRSTVLHEVAGEGEVESAHTAGNGVEEGAHFDYRSPILPPLPLSSMGRGTGSTETSSSTAPVRISPKSSALSARGSAGPHLESLGNESGVGGGGGARSSHRSMMGERTESTLSETYRFQLATLADSTCAKCGRVFSGHDTLLRHLQMQGGTCLHRSLKEELDFVGDSEND